jgi:hypothetical protein
MKKFETDYCEVCNEPLAAIGMRLGEFPEDIDPDDIFRPGEN